MEVRIRKLQEKDALISYKWRNDPEIWKYTGNTPDREITPEIELEWIHQVLCRNNEIRFAIIADEIYVGNIYLIDITNNSADLHIFIGEKKFWGKGIATLAIKEVFTYVKDTLNIKNINLKVNIDNFKAIYCYINTGFKFVSREKNFYKMKKYIIGD